MSEPQRLWSFSLLVIKRGPEQSVNHCCGTIRAETAEDAAHLAVKIGKVAFPADKGWSDHQACVASASIVLSDWNDNLIF